MVNNDIKDLLKKISQLRFLGENEAVSVCHQFVKDYRCNFTNVQDKAQKYITYSRDNSDDFGIESFFSQYPLDTKEAQAVLSLAESLIRISDSYTANKLIQDKLSGANWQSKDDSSYLMKLSSFAMKTAGKVIQSGKLISSIAEPVLHASISKSIRILGQNFVMGETIGEAIKNSEEKSKMGYLFSYDMLGEGARTSAQAADYYTQYLDAIESVSKNYELSENIFENPSISIKLSALHPHFEWSNRENVFAQLLPIVLKIVEKAMEKGLSVTIDAEESRRLDLTLEVFTKIIGNSRFEGFDGIGIAVQSYHKQSLNVVEFVADLAKFYNRRIAIRLVKGAYWDSEIKHAQVEGLKNYPVFTRKENTDVSYLACAYKMLQENSCIYPQFATHNAMTIAEIEQASTGKDFEFQLLHGMGNSIYDEVIKHHPCRIYAPVGNYRDLLPYLIRRMLENSASTSFIRKLSDKSIPSESLAEDAFELVQSKNFTANDKLPMPESIFGQKRTNSYGIDLDNSYAESKLQNEISEYNGKIWQASSIINGKEIGGESHESFSPYNIKQKVGKISTCPESEIKDAIKTSHKAFKKWSSTAVSKRSEIILKMADLLEKNKVEAIAICVKEAGKTIPDSISEVREAIDFCRYYALQGEEIFTQKNMSGVTGETNQLSMHGRGVFLCISPWNFPLAIFLGQVSAALMAGNTVIAKPAEPTAIIAHFAVKLLLQAGLPQDVISLIIGSGSKVGNILLPDNRIKGVVFTGSMKTASVINQALANRNSAIVPLIAETGGQNAMIVDSSALIEQTVDDVVMSAFGSSGQRCSALRVLYLQEEIADNFINVLSGAIEYINIGSPEFIKNNMAAVINKQALEDLQIHIDKMHKSHKSISVNLPKNECEFGHFLAPHIFEINSISDLEHEVFGPVLHIIRFKAKKLDEVIDEINNCGYGLTLGIQSRINSFAEHIKANAHVGNIYVNRTTIGAVVESQPFGGEGLSGTGPKAGGPNYLKRFATERTYTVNTSAIGGNISVLLT